jgi:hypothetical protein
MRLAIGATMMSFGLHQIISPEAWRRYIPEPVIRLMPISYKKFFVLHGTVNLILGFTFLLGLALNVVIWLVLAWWAFVMPFAFHGKWQEGVRDLCIIAALISMVILLHA